MTILVFGDIEGEQYIWRQVTRNLIVNMGNPNIKYIFLGDIYSHERSRESIDMIKLLISDDNNNVPNIITPNMDKNEIMKMFKKLYVSRSMYVCKKGAMHMWKEKPRTKVKTINNMNFIYGNKEIEFILDIISSKDIQYDVHKQLYSFTAEYTPRDQTDKILQLVEFTAEQLNIMYVYLSRCVHYIISDDTLFTHFYLNGTFFKKNVLNIVSGHNKCYGKYISKKLPRINIYLIDHTICSETREDYKEEEDEVESQEQCELIPIKRHDLIITNPDILSSGKMTLRHFMRIVRPLLYENDMFKKKKKKQALNKPIKDFEIEKALNNNHSVMFLEYMNYIEKNPYLQIENGNISDPCDHITMLKLKNLRPI